MKRWLLVLITFVGFSVVGTANAGNWSVGYTDYGRHGGYSVAVGNHGYRSFSAFGYGPSWGYGSYGYGDRWADPWYLSSYRSNARYYDDCYYGCASTRYYRNYTAPRYGYGYSYRPTYNHYPRYGFGNGYRNYDRGYARGYSRSDDRYDRRYQGRNNYRNNNYQRTEYRGRNESAYDRARDHGRYDRRYQD